MSCSRCNERRDVIKQAVNGQTSVKQAASFVVRTMAEDAGRALVRSGHQRKK